MGTLANYEDTDEMQQNASLHQSLHCLLKLKNYLYGIGNSNLLILGIYMYTNLTNVHCINPDVIIYLYFQSNRLMNL